MAGMPEEMLQNSVPPEMRSMLIAQSARMNMPQQQMNFANGGPPGGGGFPMQNMYPGMNMQPDMMGMGMGMGGGFPPGNMPMGGPGMGQFGPGPSMDGPVQMPNGMGGMQVPPDLMQQQQMQQIQQQQSTPLIQPNGNLMLPGDPSENGFGQGQSSDDGSGIPVSIEKLSLDLPIYSQSSHRIEVFPRRQTSRHSPLTHPKIPPHPLLEAHPCVEVSEAVCEVVLPVPLAVVYN